MLVCTVCAFLCSHKTVLEKYEGFYFNAKNVVFLVNVSVHVLISNTLYV